MVDHLKPICRIKKQSPMDVAVELEKNQSLPQERLPNQKFSNIQPWMGIKTATIKCFFLEPHHPVVRNIWVK